MTAKQWWALADQQQRIADKLAQDAEVGSQLVETAEALTRRFVLRAQGEEKRRS